MAPLGVPFGYEEKHGTKLFEPPKTLGKYWL